MDLNQLKELLDLVREHELSEFEIEHEGLRLKVRKDGVSTGFNALGAQSPEGASSAPVPAAGTVSSGPSSLPGAAGAQGPSAVESALESINTEIELAVVKSPIVGTFYRSPEPGSPSFVEVGASVKKGQVLCIIEAMKLMNEIDSEYDGEIVTIYVESGQPVQYGERLFAIRTR
jgi:acetyl-CoA carboxylase biotin carboxyl carrier protein